ncbi:MAG: peptidylprolyl isomerase [Gemmatimonadetes bacterium]|jgi:FKBP-type peptidyl-prolyl cis-trans isomerase 2|nr:peptidylprolyl isomerase [Gemmatimonadota bacterium]MBT4611411.1 peptidylprolyl isomerase [Gemmatimonadota bacterium]MBT5054931.1 peptidylprolyl isomerase [Gemmatimonadota bacterium]MBT5145852.1 peptidylprolyl isomerase [Gemmatimonadota bacterium]MBT5587833.1 peptidylprolyl isomerase [Gemmatimonadota bacterium]
MSGAKTGDTVKVHYTGQFEDGSVFDTSQGKDPLEFTVGTGQVIRGFEEAIEGLNTGDSTTTTIEAPEAYGERLEELLFQVDKARFPEGIVPSVGDQLQLNQPEGGMVDVVVSAIEGDTVTLDANHPLAGRVLTFKITVVDVADA